MRGRHGYGAGGLSLLSLARTLTKVSVRGGERLTEGNANYVKNAK